MKKNIDQTTKDLYNATKAAYLRECSDVIRNNAKCQPVTIDMMIQLFDGRGVDRITLAECTDLKKVINIIPGYSCSLASLPRIYKEIAKMAGEPCEKITIGTGAALNAYGLTDEQLNAKENKKIMALLKKRCPAPRKNDRREMQPFKLGVYHDSRHRCAVWTDAHILIVAPWLYNEAAAGQIVTATGSIVDNDGMPVKYPNWSIAVPDFSEETARKKNKNIYGVPAHLVAENASQVATFVKSYKKKYDNPKAYFVGARYGAGDKIIAFDYNFADAFSLMSENLYISSGNTAAVGYMAAGGFVLVMPMKIGYEFQTVEKVDEEIAIYEDNNTIFADVEYNSYLHKRLPQADPVSLLGTFIEPAPAADTEKPATAPATAAAVADAEEETPAPATAATVTDADILTQAASIKENYEAMQQQAAADAAASRARAAAAFADAITAYCTSLEEPAPLPWAPEVIILNNADPLPDPPAVVYLSGPVPPSPRRRHFTPRLRPIFRRLWRVAAVVLPLVLIALFTASSTATSDTAPMAADAATVAAMPAAARPAAADPLQVAKVIDLEAVTVTAPVVIPAPAVVHTHTPSPVKKAPAHAVTPSNQKTAAVITTAPAPAANDAATTAPSPATAPAADAAANGLTICPGTAWAYTINNWA